MWFTSVAAPVPHLRVLGRVPLRVHRGDVVDLHAASLSNGVEAAGVAADSFDVRHHVNVHRRDPSHVQPRRLRSASS